MDLPPAHFLKDEMQNGWLIVFGLIVMSNLLKLLINNVMTPSLIGRVSDSGLFLYNVVRWPCIAEPTRKTTNILPTNVVREFYAI